MTLPECKNASLQTIRREVDLAWLAGIIDGEGNIYLNFQEHANGAKYLDVKVRVSTVDIRMIEKISRILEDLGLGFCYNLGNNSKYAKDRNWKTQLTVIVSRQPGSKKLLESVLPYLANKAECAKAAIALIEAVQEFPRGGAGVRRNYAEDPKILGLYQAYRDQIEFYVDPSTTTRRANCRLAVG
jgi:hypothetical protein